jgi:hypothetical protein
MIIYDSHNSLPLIPGLIFLVLLGLFFLWVYGPRKP